MAASKKKKDSAHDGPLMFINYSLITILYGFHNSEFCLKMCV